MVESSGADCAGGESWVQYEMSDGICLGKAAEAPITVYRTIEGKVVEDKDSCRVRLGEERKIRKMERREHELGFVLGGLG